MDKPGPDRASFVLVAEDDDGVREVTTAVLCDAGWQVLCASNGREAVKLFQSNRTCIAVVVLDLMMPEMDGQLALQEIRRESPDVPVIVVSGLDGRRELPRSAADHVFAFVRKPYRIADFAEVVRRAARR